MKTTITVSLILLASAVLGALGQKQSEPVQRSPTVVDFRGINMLGALYTFPRGLSWKEAVVRTEKGAKKRELKGKQTIAANEQAALVLWRPDDAPADLPFDLSILDQFQPDDLVILLIRTKKVTAKELQRLERHSALRFLAIGPLKAVSNKDLTPLTKLRWLEKINIEGPGVLNRDLPVLQKLPGAKGGGLQDLLLKGEDVNDEALRRLSTMKNLQKLILLGKKVTDEGLKHLSGLTELRYLSLAGANITDKGLAQLGALTKLHFLSLSDTNISGAGLRHLTNMNNLAELFLEGTAINDESLRYLAGLKQLRILSLNGTQITDEGLRHLAGLRQLQKLSLNGTQIHGRGFRHLTDLERLEEIFAAAAPLQDENLKHLQKLDRLRFVYFYDTPLTDRGLMNLSGIDSLRNISVGSTKVTEEGIRRFRAKNPHVKVYD